MRKIVASVFVSLDGVMQAPGGPEEDPTGGFRHGGWVAAYWDAEIEAAMVELFSTPFDLLLGAGPSTSSPRIGPMWKRTPPRRVSTS